VYDPVEYPQTAGAMGFRDWPVNFVQKPKMAKSSIHSKTAKTSVATLTTVEHAAHKIADLMAESLDADTSAVSLVDKGRGRWQVAIYFGAAPNEKILRSLVAAAAGAKAGRELRFAKVAAQDWVGESLAGLKPVAAGRFIIHGAHDRAGIAANRIGVEIEAALAFGTGHHGTTRGCLLALDRLCKSLARGRSAPRILDLGTGSGVLAIAAARALCRPVLATDINAAAVRVARENGRLNRAAPLIAFVTAGGVTAPAIRCRAPFDLVFANILLEPLQRLASPLTRLVAPGGRVVLSGLLNSQANAALAAYRLPLQRRIEVDGWTTLVLKRGLRWRPGRLADACRKPHHS
jgi:ribosomal protein L11 methyltransferase